MAIIGIMDSGMGGLSVFREIRKALPSEHYIYYADNAHCPYGEKSPDGRTFMKSPEISARFAATPVYSDMFMEFSQDADKAVAFVKGLVPPDILPEIEKREKEGTLLQNS